MTTTDAPLAVSLAADPFTALAVHYGMLLGVPDFQVISANPRGKLRLHQAWQHGAGVVWGYDVAVPPDNSELHVAPGLAVDGLGREVALATPYCIDVAQWLDEQIAAKTIEPVVSGDTTTFNAQLVLRFRACLTRPVPAISSTCDGGGGDIAYSRILETGELELRPYPNNSDGTPKPPPDHRSDEFAALRALVRDGVAGPGVDPAADWLEAFRQVAATTAAALAPPALAGGSPTSSRLFPVDEPGDILLADLAGLQVVNTAGGPRLVAPVIDLGVRRTLVPTWVVEELLAELLAGRSGATPVGDAGGPRVADATLAGNTVTVSFTADVVDATLADAFELRSLDLSSATPAWSAPIATPLVYTAAQASPTPVPASLAFDLPAAPTADVSYRMILRGTGPTPLVGNVGGRPIPLSGSVGDPAAGAADGRDVVKTFEGA